LTKPVRQDAGKFSERNEDMPDDAKGAPLPGSERHALLNARVVGDLRPDEQVTITVYVRARSSGVSDEQIILANETPPQQRTYVSAQQIADAFGAEPEDLEKVAAWATSQGLTVGERSLSKRSIVLQGDAAAVSRAFGTDLKRYETPTETYRGRTGPVLVPKELTGVIEAVFGLDNRKMGRPYFRRAIRPLPARVDRRVNAYVAPQVASIYNFPAGLTGAGQTIGILALNGMIGDSGSQAPGGYDPSAVRKYFTALNLATPDIVDVVVHGPGNRPGNGTNPLDATGEVLLDIQTAGACAPGAKLVVYFTEFTEQGWVDAIVAAVNDEQNKPSVLSISYGNPEDAGQVSLWTRAAILKVNEAFRIAALRGITICCASGDDGSRDQVNDGRAHADFPASSPWVLSCGGTRLDVSSGLLQETVWNDGPGSAGGGGVSTLFPVPSYQRHVALPRSVNPGRQYGRVVPDVSGNADPETGYIIVGPTGDFEGPIGGTSATAPLWAALIAILNQAIGAPIGFFNPLLYRSLSVGVLRDIVQGDNGAYAAAPGYDACTGIGSPDGTRLLMSLAVLGGARSRPVAAAQPGVIPAAADSSGVPSLPKDPSDLGARLAAVEAALVAASVERQYLSSALYSLFGSLRARGLA
jgi:kumamolisin